MLADVSVESCSGIGSSSAGSASAEHVQVASALVAAAVGEALGAPEPSAANPLPLLLGEDSSDAEGSGMEAVVAAAARGSVPPIVEVEDDSKEEAESVHARPSAAEATPQGDVSTRPLSLYMGNAFFVLCLSFLYCFFCCCFPLYIFFL